MKVSVWMSAYNHENYIGQCLDSVLSQKTNFDFEIILGEDCSTDNTREIVIEYKNKFPEKFKLHLPEKNIGMMAMDLATCRMCSGEYVALLNGDDYWTDENKLQLQANFLDSNHDTVLCYHKAKIENETDGSSFETVFPESGMELPIESLLLGYNPIMTPTVMMRNVLELPDWFRELPYGDMPIYLLLSQRGKLKYINRMMSIYRIHSNGNWQGDSVYNNLAKDLRFYKILNEKLDYKYENLINEIFSQRYFDMILIDLRQNRIDEAKYLFKMLNEFETEFTKKNQSHISDLQKIIFEGVDKNDYRELINREVKWKVN